MAICCREVNWCNAVVIVQRNKTTHFLFIEKNVINVDNAAVWTKTLISNIFVVCSNNRTNLRYKVNVTLKLKIWRPYWLNGSNAFFNNKKIRTFCNTKRTSFLYILLSISCIPPSFFCLIVMRNSFGTNKMYD